MSVQQDAIALLRFFCQSQIEQWTQVPDSMERVWVRVGGIDTDAEQPIEFLSLLVVGLLDSRLISFHDECLVEELQDIRAMLLYWMLDSPQSYIFSKREQTEDSDRIWNILALTCSIALSHDEMSKGGRRDFSFQHFLSKYAQVLEQQ